VDGPFSAQTKTEPGLTVVLGAGGLLGGALVEVLAAQGQDLAAWDIEEMDVTQARACRHHVGRLKPRTVINCAAYTQVDRAEEEETLANKINVQGAANVAQAAAQVGAKVVYLSTDFIFDGQQETPYCEDDPPAPINAYGRSKWAGENATRRMNPDHLIIRTAWLFGPHGNNFVKTILRLAQDKDELNVVDDQVGSPTYSLDLAQALSRLLREDQRGTYHLVNQGRTSWFGLAARALQEAGLKVRLSPITSDKLNRKACRPAQSALNCDRLKEQGLVLRSWQEALSDYLARWSKEKQ